MPIYKYKVSIEICNQGGINAVNGFYTNFNVTPIEIVTITSNIKRDKKREVTEYVSKPQSTSFAGALDKAMEEYQSNEYYVHTYDSKSRLNPCFYAKPREYSA